VQIYMTPTSQLWDAKAGVAAVRVRGDAAQRARGRRAARVSPRRNSARRRSACCTTTRRTALPGAAIATAEAANQGLAIVDDEPFPIATTDLTAQLGKIKASGADTMLIWTASPAAALAVRQIRQLGST
jgi:hypothetical protein